MYACEQSQLSPERGPETGNLPKYNYPNKAEWINKDK